jgi:opine dehydrogenase
MSNNKKITIIGGGSTGHAAAADLTLAGFEITLFEESQFRERLKPAQSAGGIHIKGAGRQGFATINKITDDIEEALKQTQIIIVAVHARRHEDIAEICAPYLKDTHTFVITPGNVGSLVMTKKLQDLGVVNKPVIAEVESSFYACRLTGPAEATVLLPPRPKYIAAFPANHTDKVIEALRGVYETMPATNVIEAALNSPNVDTHLQGSLLNTGAIEKADGKYALYAQGLTPAVIKCIEAFHQERAALFKALGYEDRAKPESIKKAARPDEHPELDLLITASGPTSMRHRYVDENARVGVSLIISLGEMLGIPTPLARAMVNIASTMNDFDYLKHGRTLENLGLSNLTVGGLNRYLKEGSL